MKRDDLTLAQGHPFLAEHTITQMQNTETVNWFLCYASSIQQRRNIMNVSYECVDLTNIIFETLILLFLSSKIT